MLPRLVGGGKLLDLDQVSVARTAIAHAGGMGFRRPSLTESEGAAVVSRPAAVIITDDGLALAVAESDAIGGHGRLSFEWGCEEDRRRGSGHPPCPASRR